MMSQSLVVKMERSRNCAQERLLIQLPTSASTIKSTNSVVPLPAGYAGPKATTNPNTSAKAIRYIPYATATHTTPAPNSVTTALSPSIAKPLSGQPVVVTPDRPIATEFPTIRIYSAAQEDLSARGVMRPILASTSTPLPVD